MKAAGFSLVEVLVAMLLLSAFMLASFEILQHVNVLEQHVHDTYRSLSLMS